MKDIEKAKMLLQGKQITCVLCCGETTYTSTKTGISPLLDYLQEKTVLTGFSAADKIVGKAAAMLFAAAGVAEVYGEVMSRAATLVLTKYRIRYSCGVLCDNIKNRTGTGICPMEQTVAEIDDLTLAQVALRAKRAQLSGKSSN